jgi:hypothetical protein
MLAPSISKAVVDLIIFTVLLKGSPPEKHRTHAVRRDP